MNHYGLLGYPLSHTMSPPIHRSLFELAGIRDYDYTVFELPPEQMRTQMDTLLSLRGFNITIPYKVEILPYLTRLSPEAQRYGAVNCVRREADGSSSGFNTDVDGFLKTVERLGADPSGRVCVLGAGGVGRMFAIESARKGAAVTIAVREKNLPLAAQVGSAILELCPKASVVVGTLEETRGAFDLLINAVPVGMYPNTGATPYAREKLAQVGAVFDAIYNPTETVLLRDAKEMGCKTMGGMAMLVWQAVAAQRIWHGFDYNPADIDALAEEMTRQVERLFHGEA